MKSKPRLAEVIFNVIILYQKLKYFKTTVYFIDVKCYKLASYVFYNLDDVNVPKCNAYIMHKILNQETYINWR